nr:creatininase family protein [Haloactinopolyspora alba]
MTWHEVREAAHGAVAVVPVGSQEQHGSHLPLGTDRMLADAVVDEAVRRLDGAAVDLVRLPTVAYGFSPHHAFAAAVTLSAQTLVAVLGEIIDSLVATGFRRMLIVNGHGGNDEIVRLAVKQAALRADIAAAACNYWSLSGDGGDDVPAGADSSAAQSAPADESERIPGHAGWFETSLMLAAHPELVHPPAWEDTPAAPPLFDQPPAPGLVVERHGEWSRVGGVTDDARAASAAAGRQLLARQAQRLATAITEFDRATEHSHGRASG